MPARLAGVLAFLLLLSGCARSEAEDAAEAPVETPSVPAFVDVTDEVGLGGFVHETGAFGEEWFPETNGAGGAFFDYDGDGWQDVLLVGGAVWEGRGTPVPALRLYRNEGARGQPAFKEVTREAGLADVHAYGFGIAAADYDNDGDQDVFLSTLERNLLFRNDDGVFSEVGGPAGVSGTSDWSTSALFFDADRDGWLDLYVGNYVAWTPETDIWCTMDGETKAYCTPEAYEGVAGRFYRNDGDGTFTDRTRAAGFADAPGKTLGVAELDYDDDGWSDLVVANDTQRDLLYENQGDGTFVDVGTRTGIAYDDRGSARAGMGIDAGDIDNSGRATVVIGHFSNQMVGLYQNVGGYFVDNATVARIGQASLLTLTFGLVLVDVDLDGYLDLVTANGHIAPEIEEQQEGISYRQRSQLYLNRRDGVLEDVTADAGPAFEREMVARGVAYADYDRDGDLDLLFTDNGGSARLWRNDLDAAHFLRVRLEGRESSRDALGARLTAVVGDERISRRVRTGSSYLSQSETVVTFGLGASAAVDTLVVAWPSGRVDRFAGVDADQHLVLVEGSETFERDEPGGLAAAVPGDEE